MRLFFRSTIVLLAAIIVVALVLAPTGARARASVSVPPHVSLSVSSRLAPETGYVYVAYRQGADAAATVRGVVTNPPPGSSVALVASPFPFNRPSQPVATAALAPRGGQAGYSFTVTPTLATRYSVELLTAGPNQVVAGRSWTSVVYVAAGLTYGPRRYPGCSRPQCTQTFQVTSTYPLAAAPTEAAKAWNTYRNYKVSAYPAAAPLPLWLHLNHGWRVSRARLIAPGVYVTTFRTSFPIGSDSYIWRAGVCTVDTEARDGVGLPAHHRCGARWIMTSRFRNGYIG